MPSLHAACSRSSGIAAPSTVETRAAAISSTRIGSLSDSKKRRRKDLQATSLNLFAPKVARRASIEGVVATEAGTRAGPESGGVQRRSARPEGPPRVERRALSLSCCVRVFWGGVLGGGDGAGVGGGEKGEVVGVESVRRGSRREVFDPSPVMFFQSSIFSLTLSLSLSLRAIAPSLALFCCRQDPLPRSSSRSAWPRCQRAPRGRR